MMDSKKDKPQIVAIIPARGGSKGIQRKNMRLLAGKPLILWTIEPALKSKYIAKIVVSTEDEEIADLSITYRAEVIKRPVELAGDNSATIDVVKHVIEALKEKENYIPEIIVLLQPTSPLRTTEDIDNTIELFEDNDCESVISVCEVKKPLYWNFKIEGGYLEPIFGVQYFKMRRQDIEKTYVPNGAIYISKPRTLYKYKSFYCKRTIPYVMPLERSIDIDEEIDFKLAEFLLRRECEEN